MLEVANQFYQVQQVPSQLTMPPGHMAKLDKMPFVRENFQSLLSLLPPELQVMIQQIPETKRNFGEVKEWIKEQKLPKDFEDLVRIECGDI